MKCTHVFAVLLIGFICSALPISSSAEVLLLACKILDAKSKRSEGWIDVAPKRLQISLRIDTDSEECDGMDCTISSEKFRWQERDSNDPQELTTWVLDRVTGEYLMTHLEKDVPWFRERRTCVKASARF